MLKLFFNIGQQLSLKLSGTIQIEEPTVASYEEYKQQTINERLRKELRTFLLKELDIQQFNGFDISYFAGQSDVLNKLINYLIKNTTHEC